jgi:hypothetical protein
MRNINCNDFTMTEACDFFLGFDECYAIEYCTVVANGATNFLNMANN